MKNTGWIGSSRELLHYLATVNADKDADGQFLIYREPVISGLDPEEVIVSGGTEYSVNGRRCNLAHGLNGTSYGVRGVVIF